MIDGIGRNGAGRIDLQRAGASQSGGAPASVGARVPDGQAEGLQGIAAALVELGPPVDQDKVATLRQAIAEGRYRVDPEAIAERMIAAEHAR
jgi:negative regulator of flagellin synthesis FlgM